MKKFGKKNDRPNEMKPKVKDSLENSRTTELEDNGLIFFQLRHYGFTFHMHKYSTGVRTVDYIKLVQFNKKLPGQLFEIKVKEVYSISYWSRTFIHCQR